MKRTIGVGALLGAFAFAAAMGSFVKVFNDTYKVNANSALGKGKCMICHVSKMGGGALNPYGMDVKKAMGASKMLTAAALKKVEGLDSDKDGMKNGDEIKKGRMPGAKG